MKETVTGIESTTADVQLNTRLMLQHAARAHGDQEVITDMGEAGTHRYTYAEMYDRVHQAAHALNELGVTAGDAIGIYGYSTYRNVELLYAAGAIGATPFIVNVELPPDHQQFCIDHVATHAPLDVMFADGELIADLQDALDDPGRFEYVLTRRDESAPDPALDPSGFYEDLIADHPTDYDWPRVDEDTAAIIGFTSGTTGKPKAIAHSHRALYLHNISFIAGTNLHPQERTLMVPPLFHWGWDLWGLAPLSGAMLAMPGPGYPDNLLDMLFEEDITFSAGVATLFRRVLNVAQEREEAGEEVDLDGLRVMFAGQTPPRDLLRGLEEFGVQTIQGYGFSESAGGPEFVYNIQGEPRDRELEMSEEELFDYKSEVAGYLRPGVQAKLIDVEDETEQPWDGESPGDLAMRAPWCVNGYWKMPTRTAESRYGDYLRMGDFVTIDEDANVVVRDRVKDAIKSGGEWIPSPTVEELINEHEQVAETAVIAADHPDWGERPVAVVELAEGVSEAEANIDLEAHLQPYVESGDIESWWIPDDLVIVDEIPLTGTGKFNKQSLREAYGDELE